MHRGPLIMIILVQFIKQNWNRVGCLDIIFDDWGELLGSVFYQTVLLKLPVENSFISSYCRKTKYPNVSFFQYRAAVLPLFTFFER